MPSLLFELGTEEIPASYLAPALSQMHHAFEEACRERGLPFGKIDMHATPRRLVLFCAGLPERQADADEEAMGPSEKAAYDPAGKPTKALTGFARSKNVDPSAIVLKETPKGKYCSVRIHRVGKGIQELLPEILSQTVRAVSSPKSMRWDIPNITFARPIRSILALCDESVVPFSHAGVTAGRTTWGHPFLSPGAVDIHAADLAEFKKALRRVSVVLSSRERRDLIALKVNHLLKPHGSEVDDRELLDEVANLVEFPNAMECTFESEFLELPDAVLEAAMKGHQRYFPVRDRAGELLNKFIVISNRAEADADKIREGNERVLRARLADAKYFWTTDQKRPLPALRDRLTEINYLGKLGSVFDRTARVRALAVKLTPKIDGDPATIRIVERAADLCKADLLTEMVGEFPELQGVMGGEYARVQGEPEEVADAIREHYLPRSNQGELPQTPAGVALAITDKVDHLVACFSINERPSGSADPYGLRRAGIGIIRIIHENAVGLPLREACEEAFALLPAPCREQKDTVPAVIEFLKDRLFQMCVDSKVPHDLVRALLAGGFNDLTAYRRRMEAMMKCAKMPTWSSLVTIVERTYNISKALPETDGAEFDPALLKEPTEEVLGKMVAEHRGAIAQLIEMGKYEEAAVAYNRIFSEPVHAFFKNVFVNVDDPALRTNRLRLLRNIHRLFADRIAHLELIQLGSSIGAAKEALKAETQEEGELTSLARD